uniref:Uncharacterized protein n=1 Tax=Aegilops tauschii TaxID=37682 RepID=R7W582_AEGTA
MRKDKARIAPGMLADQDTQFSNKHAEMLKIWKFVHKLDHQVFLVHVQWEANSVERVSDASPRSSNYSEVMSNGRPQIKQPMKWPEGTGYPTC